jgi:hypothetical protein
VFAADAAEAEAAAAGGYGSGEEEEEPSAELPEAVHSRALRCEADEDAAERELLESFGAGIIEDETEVELGQIGDAASLIYAAWKDIGMDLDHAVFTEEGCEAPQAQGGQQEVFGAGQEVLTLEALSRG